MTGYIQVNLNDMIEELGEDRTKEILSSFSSPQNMDVESFLKTKAIEFSKQGLSITHLVFTSYRETLVLIGYYTLANKTIVISNDKLSGTMKRRLAKFARFNPETKSYILSAPLIAQLGKNYFHKTLITGAELLKMACDKVRFIQSEIGGRFAYLECEEKEVLMDFYHDNGFQTFGKRELDKDEYNLQGSLVQMLTYLR